MHAAAQTGTFVSAGASPATENRETAPGWTEVVEAIRELQAVPDQDLDRLASVSVDDPSRLAKVLVQAKLLTPYQAGAILQGKARGLAIGPYLVEDKLGVGGMGVVFKARYRPTGQLVALKILPPSFARDGDAVRRFRREFQVASRLSHPNIVAAIEASEDRGVHYLTMEYIPGYDLDRLVAQGGPLAIKPALHCVIQAARGLEAAHAQGVIHRDIKPGNLMIDPAGELRVLDLGLARVIEASSPFGRTADGSLTQTGSLMGTVDFLAPEQAENAKAADARSDIYSLGCTLYFLLTGKPPFAGDTILKRLMAHQQRPAPSLRLARPEVSEALDEVFQRMMAKRPSDRPQTMSEVVLSLEACRSSSREAGDASADLKTFARTILKRAPERRRRGLDASIFARPNPDPGDLTFDPDLTLEDLVGDYRKEGGREPIAEEKLPPIVSRPLPRRVRRRPSSAPVGLIALAIVGVTLAAYAFRPQAGDERIEAPALEEGVSIQQADRPVPIPVAAKVEASGFRPIFNGVDLSGWKAHPLQKGGWTVQDGVLVGSGPMPSHLFTERDDYRDFRLHIQARINDGGNGGVFLRCPIFGPVRPVQNPIWPVGYEAQVNSTHWNEDRTGSLRAGAKGEPVVVVRESIVPAGQWFELELTARGNMIRIKVNDVVTATYIDENRLYDEGSIALQTVGRMRPDDKESVIEFRKIEIEELTAAPPPKAQPAPSGVVAAIPAKVPSGRLLYSDEFDNPASGWPTESPGKSSEKADVRVSYIDGLYRLEARNRGGRIWKCPSVPPSEFICEVVGRVHSDWPGSSGSMAVNFDYGDKSLGISIDLKGRVEVRRKSERTFCIPRFTHPAIHTGPEAFNRVLVRVREGHAEFLLNGTRVCQPIEVDPDRNPTSMRLGFSCSSGIVRLDWDKVEIREFQPDAPRAEPPTMAEFQTQYEVLRPGGRVRQAVNTVVDSVSAHYVARLPGGKELENTRATDVPAVIRLGEDTVPRGWARGLSSMSPGEIRRIWVASGHALRPRPGTPAIPPDAIIEYDVELLSILSPAR